MKIQIAKSAGFCFGVNRAVEMVYSLLREGKQVYTLGPIIHNPQMVRQLGEQGVQIVQKPEEVPAGGTVVIRSHGVPQNIMDRIQELGTDVADAIPKRAAGFGGRRPKSSGSGGNPGTLRRRLLCIWKRRRTKKNKYRTSGIIKPAGLRGRANNL